MSDLKPCPFCGSEDIEIKYIGNAHTKTRKVQLKCKSCRVTRTDGAIYHDHEWCYETAAKQWNTRTSGWISCEERLPGRIKTHPNSYGDTHSAVVDVYGDGERWPNCIYDFNDEIWIDPDTDMGLTITVTHWKSLPDKPVK